MVAAAPPSTAVAVSALNCTVSSLSARDTLVDVAPLAAKPVGIVPKPMVTLSPSSSVSSVAVKVLRVSEVVKDTLAGIVEWSAAVAPALRLTTVRGMLTAADGALPRVTVTVAAAPPSVAVKVEEPKATVMSLAATSLSARDTVVVVVPLAAKPVGIVPKPMVMPSPSSSSVSSVAVKVLLVSEVVKDTLAGIVEWSAAVAPALRLTTVRGMLTAADGALPRVTVTVAAAPPSVAV